MGAASAAPFGATSDLPLGPTGPRPSNVQMFIDAPANQSTVAQPFVIGGWAVDLGAATGGVTSQPAGLTCAGGAATQGLRPARHRHAKTHEGVQERAPVFAWRGTK